MLLPAADQNFTLEDICYGYFVLLSNDIKNSVEALDIYRNKDRVEKAFENLKDRLNMRWLAVSSEQSLDGKLFVKFLALIFLSCIKKKRQDATLFKKYTLQEILGELDAIECFEIPGKRLQVGEMTNRQQELYLQLGFSPPTSLQQLGNSGCNGSFSHHWLARMGHTQCLDDHMLAL